MNFPLITGKDEAFDKSDTKGPEECAKESHHMRDQLTEKQIDKTLQDSFPASDPPAWY